MCNTYSVLWPVNYIYITKCNSSFILFCSFFFMNFCLSCPTHFFLITFLLVLLLLLFRLNFFSCCSMENDYDSICLKQYTKKKAIHRAFCCCFVSIQWNVNCVGHIDQCDNQLDLIFSHSHCAQRSSRHIQQANKKKVIIKKQTKNRANRTH